MWLNIETMATMIGRGYNNPPRDSCYQTSHRVQLSFFFFGLFFPHLTRSIRLGSKAILVLLGTICSTPLDQNNAVIPSIIWIFVPFIIELDICLCSNVCVCVHQFLFCFLQFTSSIPGRSDRNKVKFSSVKSLRNHRSDVGALRTNLINAFCGITVSSGHPRPYHFAFRIDTRSNFVQQ